MKKVLILGGGFAGVEAAIFLRKQNIDVTLVSDRDYFYIYPTSIWIPVGAKSREDVSVPLKDLASAHGFEFILGKVKEIKAKEKMAILSNGLKLDGYDDMIAAIGHAKTKIEGMGEHTLSICGKPEEAEMMRDKIDILVKKGGGRITFGFGGNPKDKSSVRGGPVFEVMFNVHNYLKKLGLRDKFELTFFAPMASPGEKMGPKALVMMERMFNMCNINKQVGVKISSFVNDGIVFEDDSKLTSDLTIFTAAGMGHDIFANSDLPLSEAGYIATNEFNEVEGMSGVWAIGDSAFLLGSPEWKAKQGHVAEVMARNVAHNISNPNDQKSYIDHLNILCVMDIGNGAAFVYRSTKKALMIPMPIVGHWMKLGWGWYCKQSKLGKIPRIPGM